MDFVSGLPRTMKSCDNIWVIVNMLTKFSHFIPIQLNYLLEKLVELYVEKIISLHGIPFSIVSDMDLRFMSWFWEGLHKALGTDLHFSYAYNLQING